MITVDLHQSLRNLQAVKLHGWNTRKYCEDFTRCLLNSKIAVEQYCYWTKIKDESTLEIPPVGINIVLKWASFKSNGPELGDSTTARSRLI